MYHESFQSINLLSSMKRRKMKKMVIHDLGFKRCTKIALSFCQDIHLILRDENHTIFFVNLHGRNMFYINEIRKYIAGRTYVFAVDVTIFVTDFYQAQMTITEHKL